MIGLDTNILVRYLTRDDEQQWQQTVTIIQQHQPCFICRCRSSPLGRYNQNSSCFGKADAHPC